MIVTYTGKYFDFNNMSKDSIDITDIAHSLSRISRFIGHSTRAYSVCEHTLVGLMMCMKMGYTKRQQFHWLVHDFTEAYVGDCPSPLKAILPDYQRIEKEVSRVIYEYIGIDSPTAEEKLLVNKVDRTMLVVEMRDLTLHNYHELLNDNVYLQMLDDKDFILSQGEISATGLTTLLIEAYSELLEEVKKDG